jgi:hypothetical protein
VQSLAPACAASCPVDVAPSIRPAGKGFVVLFLRNPRERAPEESQASAVILPRAVSTRQPEPNLRAWELFTLTEGQWTRHVSCSGDGRGRASELNPCGEKLPPLPALGRLGAAAGRACRPCEIGRIRAALGQIRPATGWI